MRLTFLVLAIAACASGPGAQAQFQVRPITTQNGAPAIRTANPVAIPRTTMTVHPVFQNVSPVRPVQTQQPVIVQPQRLSPAQSRALNNAVRTNNYNLYHDTHDRYVTQNQTVENPANHIARLQRIIQSGMQPTSVRPGAGLGYGTTSASYTRETIRQVQTALRQLGYYHGQVDGQFGSGTQDALENYQLKANRPATGLLDRQTLSQLGVEAK